METVNVPAGPPNTPTAEPPGQGTSAVPLNQFGLEVSQVPDPPPVAVPVAVGSQLRVWARATVPARATVSSENRSGRAVRAVMRIRLRRGRAGAERRDGARSR